MSNQPSIEAGLRAIETLNQQDMTAVLANDIATITSQWTEDFVVLSSAGPLLRGRSANIAIAESAPQQLQAIEPIEYVAQFEEIQGGGDPARVVHGEPAPCGADQQRGNV